MLPTEFPRGRGVALDPKTAELGEGRGIASVDDASGGTRLGVNGTAADVVVGVAVGEEDDAGVGGIGGRGPLVPKTWALALSRSFKLTILLLLLLYLYSCTGGVTLLVEVFDPLSSSSFSSLTATSRSALLRLRP